MSDIGGVWLYYVIIRAVSGGGSDSVTIGMVRYNNQPHIYHEYYVIQYQYYTIGSAERRLFGSMEYG